MFFLTHGVYINATKRGGLKSCLLVQRLWCNHWGLITMSTTNW